ncbi:hypothetical protein [Myroides odoratus]|uniref:hypothetical protein n=1 Tax=Myroides odoratus TaxID=256 RepID=UPI000765E3DF|nr:MULTISPECIES: hypothetical protein [Myroides]WHT40396.1 hypothetical protein QNH98_07405 [Myroides sp. mNGS23_01]
MKKPAILTLLLLTMSTGAFAQMALDRIDANPKWKQYDHFYERDASSIYPHDRIEYELEDGRIKSYRLYYNNDELGKVFDVFYNDQGQVYQEVLMYDADRGQVREVVFESSFTYDDKGVLIDDGEHTYTKIVKGRPMIVTSREYSEEYERGFSTVRAYNESGTIRLEKTTFFDEGEKKIRTSTYKYDSCGNVSEVSTRTTIAPNYTKQKRRKKDKTPPVRPVMEKEEFAYEYDGDCIWTKKYKVENGEKTLLRERELVK